MRNFGNPNQGSRLHLGGASAQPATYRANTPRESVNDYFPAQSILAEPTSRPPLKRSNVLQTLRDIGALIGILFFICVFIGSIAFALVFPFFVKF